MKTNFKIKKLMLKSSIILTSTLTLNGCYKLEKNNKEIKSTTIFELSNNDAKEALPTPTPSISIEPIIDEKEVLPTPTPSAIIEPIIIEDKIIEAPIVDERKPVAITFDDGPSAYTIELLDLLDKYNIKATFFVLEYNCKNYNESLIEIANRGHEIAIHGSTHTSFKNLTIDQINNEINSTILYIETLDIDVSNLVRPPYGAINSSIKENIDYPFITWNIDTEDWKNRNKDLVANEILNNINEGCIILMHDTKAVHEADMDALNEILPELIKEYNFVTVSELAELNNIELEENKIYRKIKSE